MMHKSFRRSPTAEERRVVRNWAWSVLIVYSAVVLAAFGLVTLSQRLANESKDPAAAPLTATADGNQRARQIATGPPPGPNGPSTPISSLEHWSGKG